MRREGNRNFGVWNAPTGMDSVRRSVQVDFDLVVRLNNPKFGKELEFMQLDGGGISRSQYPDTSLMFVANDKLKAFRGMARQGWGG